MLNGLTVTTTFDIGHLRDKHATRANASVVISTASNFLVSRSTCPEIFLAQLERVQWWGRVFQGSEARRDGHLSYPDCWSQILSRKGACFNRASKLTPNYRPGPKTTVE